MALIIAVIAGAFAVIGIAGGLPDDLGNLQTMLEKYTNVGFTDLMFGASILSLVYLLARQYLDLRHYRVLEPNLYLANSDAPAKQAMLTVLNQGRSPVDVSANGYFTQNHQTMRGGIGFEHSFTIGWQETDSHIVNIVPGGRARMVSLEIDDNENSKPSLKLVDFRKPAPICIEIECPGENEPPKEALLRVVISGDPQLRGKTHWDFLVLFDKDLLQVMFANRRKGLLTYTRLLRPSRDLVDRRWQWHLDKGRSNDNDDTTTNTPAS